MSDPLVLQKKLNALRQIPYENKLIPMEVTKKLLSNPRGWVIGIHAFKLIKNVFRHTMDDDIKDEDFEKSTELVQKKTLQKYFKRFIEENDKDVLNRLKNDSELSDIEIIEVVVEKK